MKHNLKFNLILVILLMTVCWIEASFRTKKYTALGPGQNITGKITESYTSNTMDCLIRCLSDDFCVACATTDDKRYVIIQRRGTEKEKQTLVSDAGVAIFNAKYTGEYTVVIWGPPGVWSGPPAVLYRSFDTLSGLRLMAEIYPSNFEALIPGKVNKANATNSSQEQWVKLGIMSEACITLPDTCGPEGAAVAVWVKIYECANSNGFLSSLKSEKTGFMFYCFTASIRPFVPVENRKFSVNIPNVSNLYIHLVLNFIGPNSGEGIQAFRDGAFIAENQSGADGTHTVGDGRVIVGRKHANVNKFYAHVEVDELIFFNEALSNEEVGQLYNMYQ